MKHLSDVRRRVERLTARVKVGVCQDEHVRVKVDSVWDDAPAPAWPPEGAPKTCACGRPIEYRHVVHQYRWQS